MSDTTKDQDKLTEEEAAAKRDETLKRMLNTPPKPRPKNVDSDSEIDSTPSK
tara:strand:- start:2396 stop:2551 length:156 start_codon:yes stop_codon:yes gene_type:complete